eukprot:2085826-Rhodomonas_salina.2
MAALLSFSTAGGWCDPFMYPLDSSVRSSSELCLPTSPFEENGQLGFNARTMPTATTYACP